MKTDQKYVAKGARISSCGTYRYSLWREWRGTHNTHHWRWFGEKDGAGKELGEPLSVLFVMLNPSTADGEIDDATIRKCVGFAKLWKYERVEVVNLFAYRTTSPKDLFAAKENKVDIIGPRNQEVIQQVCADAALIVCAWGGNAKGHEYHVEEVRGWLEYYENQPQFHLGLTQEGFPRHPLYVPYSTKLQPMPK